MASVRLRGRLNQTRTLRLLPSKSARHAALRMTIFLSSVRLKPSASSPAEEDRFLLQGNGEEGLNLRDDGVAEFQEVGASGGAGAVGES
jgi:hypothetical protein